MTNDSISYNVENQIATLFINRPEVMNAFRIEDFELFINGITLAENDPEVKVIKVKSAGTRVFSGGLDLTMVGEFGTSPGKLNQLLEIGDRIVELFTQSKKPIVVQVQGPAVGWGTILCLNADFVIAGENPKSFFQLNEINLGLFPGTGALSSALLQMGLRQAKRMLLLPEKMYLDQAERYNLVTKRVPLENLEQETDKFCKELADKELILLMTIKGLLNNQHMSHLSTLVQNERKIIDLLLNENPEKALEFLDSLWKT
jgi:enoyl-CoA hydratase/carnithine racemase